MGLKVGVRVGRWPGAFFQQALRLTLSPALKTCRILAAVALL